MPNPRKLASAIQAGALLLTAVSTASAAPTDATAPRLTPEQISEQWRASQSK